MNYPFQCPKCGHKETITMSMKEYTGEGHMCPECGEEMKREIDSMVCRSIDKTGDFYRSLIKNTCCYGSTNKDHWRNGERAVS